MDAPSPAEVRAALATLGVRERKIVGGLLAVLIENPAHVKDREWVAEQLTYLTLLSGELDLAEPDDGVAALKEYLAANAGELLEKSYLLYGRVGQDLQRDAPEGFTAERALGLVKAYLGA